MNEIAQAFVDVFKAQVDRAEANGSLTYVPHGDTQDRQFDELFSVEAGLHEIVGTARKFADEGMIGFADMYRIYEQTGDYLADRIAAEEAQIDAEIAADDAYARHVHGSLVESLSFRRGAAGQYLRVIQGGKGGFTPRTEVTQIDTITYG